MQDILFLDAGNSRIKAASSEEGAWRDWGSLGWDDVLLENRLASLCRPFDSIVLSTVKKKLQATDLKVILTNNGVESVAILEIDRTSLPLDRIRYRTPETLGIDRFLVCLGAWSQNQNQNQNNSRSPVIVTDAGTACTIDIMDAGGIFLGGVIMPGLQMLISSLGRGADGLFEVSPQLPGIWPPDSTETALQAGTTGTFIAAWEWHIERCLTIFPDANIWLTGGDAESLMRHTDLPCVINKFLVFEGMQEWLKIRK